MAQSPYELREYGQKVVKYVNSDQTVCNDVIDLGCGLGDVIRLIKATKRYRYDLDENTIMVAKSLDRLSSVNYMVGFGGRN